MEYSDPALQEAPILYHPRCTARGMEPQTIPSWRISTPTAGSAPNLPVLRIQVAPMEVRR